MLVGVRLGLLREFNYFKEREEKVNEENLTRPNYFVIKSLWARQAQTKGKGWINLFSSICDVL